jgi:dihydroorotate dehydrogenase (NAD+) catalytic subunit
MALRCVRDAYEALSIPVVGIGGILDAEDAMEFIVAGATAVQVGTATFADPRAAERVVEGLDRLLDATPEPDVRAWVGTLSDTP